MLTRRGAAAWPPRALRRIDRVQLARAARWLLGPKLAFAGRLQAHWLTALGPAWTARWNAMLADAWLRDRLNRCAYRHLGEPELRARRRSDTVFVFGSGSSLNDIGEAEWRHFGDHDVFGFNEFFRQRWVRVDYHLLRVGVEGSFRWRPYAEHVARGIADNRYYGDTALLLQEGYLAGFSNQLVGYKLLPRTAPIGRYRAARGWGPPGESLREGLRHAVGTLADTVNAAYVLGWKRIVLVGVDLYDSRYFWLPRDQTSTSDPVTGLPLAAERNAFRGVRFDELHSTARNGMVDLLSEWRAYLDPLGVELHVYNERSLLAAVLPVYRHEEHAVASAAAEL